MIREPAQTKSRALPKGYALPHHYVVEDILGVGGFGITYRCRLEHTKEYAAVKEFFPPTLAYRQGDSYDLTILQGQETLFQRQMDHVMREARILMELSKLDAIVNIRDVFSANHTIYLVLDLVEGITLAQHVKEHGPLPYDELEALITPVMRALIQVHKKGFLHRDISPENLVLEPDHKLTLIDFGSATITADFSSKETTVILKKGYAPPEQYLPDGNLGPWTDVYSLCATMYYALTGSPPPEALQRYQGKALPALTDHAPLISWKAAVIERGLSLAETDRYPTMEQLYQSLLIPPLTLLSGQRNDSLKNESAKTVLPSALPKEAVKKSRKQNRLQKAGYLILLLLFSAVFLGIGMRLTKQTGNDAASTTREPAVSTTSSATKSSKEAATSTQNVTEQKKKEKKAATTTAASTRQTNQSSTTATPGSSTNSSKKTKTKKDSSKKDEFFKLTEEDPYESFSD